jgi:hypothetical protein
VSKQKDRHLFKQKNKQKSFYTGGFLFVFLITVAASALGMAVPNAEAAFGINKQINYQGRLMDSSGQPVGDGNYQMQFKLYNQASGGSHIWSASTTNGLPTGSPSDVTVEVKSGLFTVLLGDTGAGQVPLDIDWNNDTIFLGVKIDTDSEMVPRKRLTAVPYALNAMMLQGQYASNTVDIAGGVLFSLNQTATNSAVATRTALFIESLGTSNQFDYLVRMSNGSADVFTVNRLGNVTTTGSFALGGNLSIQGIRLDSVGSNPLTSGAYLVGVYDEFTFSNATTVQAALKDLDTALGNVSSSAMGLTLQDVANNGNTTTNSLEFYGGTSTGDLMPGAHLTYDLGAPGRRWDEIFVQKTRIGTNSWTLEADTNNTFLISEDTFGNYFAITQSGRVGIGTSTPSLFDLEVNGTIGPSQHNLYDLGSLTSSWRNIIAQGTVSSTDAIFGSANIGSLSVTNLTIGNELDLSNLVWLNATGTNSILGNLTVTSTLSLPNDSVTDAMVSDSLTIGDLGNVSATSITSGVLGNSNVVLSLDSFGSITGRLSASQISVASTNMPNSLDLQSYLNMLMANGRAFGGETIQTASGTVMVTAGEGLIASDPTNPGATVYHTSWATSTGIDVPMFEWFNIYLHYNAGNPTIVATTTDYSDDWTYFALSTVYNHGDGQLHIHDERSLETRPINKIIDFLEEGIGQIVTDGCMVSDVGIRGIAVSQCTNWYASFKRIIPAFSTENGDKFDVYYRNGTGGFINIHDYSQWDNGYYDDNSGTLQAVGPGEFGEHWVYIHEQGQVSLIYGRESYADLAQAVAAPAPTNLPLDFLDQKHAFLIGAIIFEQGTNSPAVIRDLRPVLVSRDGSSAGGGSSISNHNDLSSLQGGAPGEYYHLSATGFEADNELIFSSSDNNNITLNANGTANTKVIINNAYAGTTSLDIMDGALMLNSITRIDNAGNGFLNNLNLSSSLYVSGTALLTTLTVGDATSTNLFASNANFTNATAGLFNTTDLFWTNATGTNAFISNLTGNMALFTDLIATNATFTQLVVMDNTTIENLTFGNATGGNLVTYGTVSSTFIYVANSILGYATAHNMIVDESLRVGVGDFPIVGDSVAQFGGTVDSYLQVNLQNHSSGTNASGDYIVTADIGDDESYYVDLGINSSNYNNPDFSITGPLDAYLYANSANLTIGTATSGSMIKFHAGGTEATDEVMRITSDHFVGIGTTAPSHTLDVDGDGRFTGLLTLSSATTSELFWGSATGTDLYVTNLARLPSNTRIGGISVCLLDGTNCPSSTSPDLQTVTNTGNTTTNWLQFAGGTSTADFRFAAGLKIDGYGDFNDFEFASASGTNLIVTGYATTSYLYSEYATLGYATASNLWVDQTLRVGIGNIPIIGDAVAQFGGNIDSYLQVNIQNQSSGANASSDFVATADIGDDDTYYIDLGINSSNYSDPDFSIMGPLDGYLYVNSANLTIGTATSGSMIKFHAGGTEATDEVMRITADHYVGIGTTTPSYTLDVDGDGRFTGLLTLSSATTSELFWGNATGTNLYVTNLARLPANTMIGGVSVCLLDGTNCPSSASADLQTVTNTGNTTTNWLQFAGGTSTADFWMQQGLTIDGVGTFQDFSFVNATGSNLSLSGIVSSTSLYSGDAHLANTTMANATATNLVVETLRAGSGSFPVLGVSIAQFGGDFNNYLVVNARNMNAGDFASANFTASADVATTGNNFNTTMGIANSGFNSPFFTIAGPLDSYLMGNSNDLLIVAATSSSVIKFAAGGTLANNEVMRITSDHYVGIGTTTPSRTLDVDGDGRFTGLLTLSSATTSELFWGSATGTNLRVVGPARLSLDTRINGILPCLADGTNCPSSAASNLQTVTNAGNTTTHAIQFAGGTSTVDFRFQQDVWIDGNVSSTSALFINATGTNLALLGYINSNLNPMLTDTYTLGDETHRWQGLTVNYVTSTNVWATGFVSSSAMYINGQAVTTSVPTLNQVTTQGNVTTNAIQFGGGTTTGSILPGLTDAYNLGSADYRWNQIFANTLFVGTSTPWNITETALNHFTVSRAGSEKMRIDNAGNMLFATTTYSYGLDDTFTLSGDDAYFADKLGVGGSLYAGTDLRVGASSTIYSQSSLTKTGVGDFLFDFSGAVGTEELITGFEGSFPPSGWTTGGNANWTQDNSTFSEGSFSTRSGVITHNQISYINYSQIFTSNGILEFDWKVSSEATYDFLMFCLDSNVTCTTASGGYYARISGEVDWVTVTVPITAGYHDLRWAYEKDISIDNGSDAGWIDNIRFTPSSGQSWRFFTESTERFTIASDGNVGVGVSVPEAKLHVDGTGRFEGSVTIGSQGSRTATAWTNSALPSAGIESIRSLATFNGYLYAGQGDNAGDGDIQVCNPTAGGNPQICDVAADWSVSYNNASASRVNSLLAYKGRLYAGEGDGAGLGVVRYCRPELTGDPDVCESGDWATANFPAGPQQINHLVEYNGYLYAANDTGVSGSASIGICNPAGGGNVNDCDNAADWTNIALPVAGYEKAWNLVVYGNRLYAGVGNSNRDNDLFVCTPSTAGDSARCDNAADWTRIINFNLGAWDSIRSSAVYNGLLYQGQGDGSGDGDLMVCDPSISGDPRLCDNPLDYNNLSPTLDNGLGFNSIPALYVYDGVLFIGNEGATGNGSVIEYDQSILSNSLAGTGYEAVYDFVEFNGYLYAGRGNATGNGQVWYYQRARTTSNALSFEAGSSIGSMWFANESFMFSHGLVTEAGAFDLAESYPTLDNDLQAGEVVALDPNNGGYVKRADKAYDGKLLGVVSTKPGFLLAGTKDKDVKTAAIALVGRVPVKVSLENGDITIGDPLTSASMPGYAMKATKPGMIIGHAMEDFAELTSTSTQELSTTSTNTGTVIMVVQTGYYFGSQETSLGQLAGFLGETTSTQIIQQAFAGDAYAIEQVAGGLVNPQYADGSALNDISFAQLDVLIVKTAALVAGDLTVGGDTRLMGRVIVSDNTAGVVDLPIGDNFVEIRFSAPFETIPVVVVTPESDADEYFAPWLGKFRIAKKTVNGFRIEVDEGACMDPSNCGRTMKFNWIAVGVKQSEVSSSTSMADLDTSTETIMDSENDEQNEESEQGEIIVDDESGDEDSLVAGEIVEEPVQEVLLETTESEAEPVEVVVTETESDAIVVILEE